MNAQPRAPEPIRCVSYNIRDGGGDRLAAQIELLRVMSPTLLCIQEAKEWDAGMGRTMYAFANALGLVAAPLALSDSHRCHLAMFYDPTRLRPTAYDPRADQGTAHHRLVKAEFETTGGIAFTVLHTHLGPFSPAKRLEEVGWFTEAGGTGHRTVLLGDLNTRPLHRGRLDWSLMPRHLWSRHRSARGNRFADRLVRRWSGDDHRAIAELTSAGFRDPYDILGIPHPVTVGHWSPDEPQRRPVVYGLVAQDIADWVENAWTDDSPAAQEASDHLPFVLDLLMRAHT
ncbi:endonuclease/exonuclease/phosphatase family protein [Embleya sp. NPDC050154]|uniref:endonuclease/exonuclease/phosphatase family protein n=1 Tax=Embleya sp. NPDC050154 TaxID=3363988 RepID=UPI0037A9017E